MNRIDEKFKRLKKKNETALISYIMMGDPSPKDTVEIVKTVVKSGVDIVELGIPYSDPLADGPVIEAAGLRALSRGFKLDDAFSIAKEVRKYSEIPLVFMCYYNTVFGYGKDEFIKNCIKSGIDGVIIPDLPMEERDEILPTLSGTGIKLIPLIAVTSRGRISSITKNAEGFVYCVSSLGVTGVRSNFHEDVFEVLKEVKGSTDIPICVGFGIGTPEDINKFKPYVDGVIVGSAIVKKIDETNCDISAISKFTAELKSATI